ncbi:hypothetical protein DTO217A2_722 [Paecilomyces variotii]|nr:hypothetical protein DTO217A2_722 [Paecilomyces variotii]
MECGSAEPPPGFEPNFLENWQSDGAFSIASWDRPGFDQSPEWDTSQESSQADIGEFSSLHGALARDQQEGSHDFPNLDYSNPGKSQKKFGFLDGTITPDTLPSSTDDNLPREEQWTQFQIPEALMAAMPMDAPMFYSYEKGPRVVATNSVILDGSHKPLDQGFHQLSSGQVTPFQHTSPTFQLMNESWPDSLNAAPAPVTELSDASVSDPQRGDGDGQAVDLPAPAQPLDLEWFDELDVQIPANMTSTFSVVPQNLGLYDDYQVMKKESLEHSDSPLSGPEDVSGAFDGSYSATHDDISAFANRQLSEEDTRFMEWNDMSPGSSTSNLSHIIPNAGGFAVGQGMQQPASVSIPTKARSASSLAHRGLARHTSLSLQPVTTARKRKQRNAASIDISQQPKPLQIVQEDGQGGSISSADFVSPPRGARRKGPLSTVGRANAGMRRKNKDTCVQCRLNKRKCDGGAPCDACRPTLHEQPCARACFASIVEYGTCNYISQRAINHPTLSGSGRMRMEIPSAFNLNDLLSLLSERRGRFNIRATQAWGTLYVLDLGETYKFLKGLTEYNGNASSTFLEFIDRRIIESKDKSKNWLACVRDCDPMNNIFSLLSQWNNMPSRAAYSFVPVDENGQERLMDVNDPEDQKEILLAAQLSRIFCRMLEVEGFRKLERDFYNIKWKRISHEAHLRFLDELGHILLTLRWRVSWWKLLGDGGVDPDPSKQHYVDRVQLLCRILYVYYTSVLAKLPSWSAADVPKGVWSTYADANPVWDDFPADATDNGFNEWMERGRDLIEQGGVPSRVAKF